MTYRLQVTYNTGEWRDYMAPLSTLKAACDLARGLFTHQPGAWRDGIRVCNDTEVVYGIGVLPTYTVRVRQPGRSVWKPAFGGRNVAHEIARAKVAELIGSGLYQREETMTERDTYDVDFPRMARVYRLSDAPVGGAK